MKRFKITIDSSGDIISGLTTSLKINRMLQECTDDEVILDFTGNAFVPPMFIVSATVCIHSQETVRVTLENCTSYMHNVKFNIGGADSGKMRFAEFSAFMESYKGKTYIPLIKFPANGDKLADKGDIMHSVENILIHRAGLDKNIANGIRYMLSEITDNISEHSNADYGYIMAQDYSTKRYVDICVGDNGITLLGSYLKTPEKGIKTDLEAMRAANTGVSTKERPLAENRGFGIPTTRHVIVEGMGGQYMMLSGEAAYIKTPQRERCGMLHGVSRVNGTIVAFRVPYQNKKFNLYDFLE